jgi:DNA-binding beta-propeller fold protein YncE
MRVKEKLKISGERGQMKTYFAIILALCFAVVSNAWGQSVPMQTMSGVLGLVQTIPLPTEGYMDRLTVDAKGQRLFICGEVIKSLVVVDLRAGKVIHVTKGLSAMPKRPVYLPDTNEIWVTLTDNTVVAISGVTYEVVKTVHLSGYGDTKKETDNAAYDPATHLLYAGIEAFKDESKAVDTGGGGDHAVTGASIEVVDTQAGKLVGSIKLPGSDPAGITIEPSGRRLYVAMGDVVEGQSHVAVVDLEKRAVVAQWPIVGGPVPHAAGVDEEHHRLFVGSRIKPHTAEMGGGHQYEPGKLIVMDTESGKVVQALDSVGGADVVQYDETSRRIYFTGTTGTVAVFKELDPDHFQLLGKVPTGAISKTGLWVPELKRFYSAVPRHYVLTPPNGTKDLEADLRKELNDAQAVEKPILSNLIVEEAHLMVFDYLP